MDDINIYILFGSEESIKNYINSIDNLLNESTSVDYLVCSYEKSNLNHAIQFKEKLQRFGNFLFITQKDYQLIHQKLCLDARTFMKKS